MSRFTYKKFNGEDFILMAKCEKKTDAIQKAGTLRAKYGKARVAKTKDGKFGIFCNQ